MALEGNSAILALVAVAAALALLQGVDSAVYNVGGSFGWRPPSGGFTYQSWAAQQTFVAGDTLVFGFVTGRHTAALVIQSDYDNCNTTNPLTVQTTGPANYTLRLGQSFFICTVSDHCASGQKLAVNAVASAARSPAGSPSPQPSSNSPSGSGDAPTSPQPSSNSPSGFVNAPPSPRGNSATSTAVSAAALIFSSIAVSFFIL